MLLISLGLSLTATAFAQVRDTAAIFGTVTDPQGAAIPNVTVTLTHSTTGQVRNVRTGQAGEYLVNLLPVGTYRLDIETPGFQHYQRTGVLVHADENARVDVALVLGDVKSTVSVSAAASQVETRSVTIKDTVDAARVVELPLNGRDPGDLALLTPGTVSGEGGSSGSTGEGATIRGEKTFSMNGSRQNDVRFTLDGGINMDNLYNYGSPFPFPDAVQEFSVESSNMGFDHGNASSGAINIVTKSGTNQVHGDAFWFVRNTVMDASNFFSHQQDQLKQNQAGFTLGGPIKKNKLFAFGGWEDLQIRTASGASRALTLSKAEQTGDFSAPGEPTITDPLTSLPFPGNIIPPARLSKAAQNLLALTPPPQPDGFAYFSYSLPEHDYQYIGRADYTVNEKNNLMFRYFRSTQSLPYHSPPNDIFDAQSALANLFDSGTLA
jgi:hypothetical protein